MKQRDLRRIAKQVKALWERVYADSEVQAMMDRAYYNILAYGEAQITPEEMRDVIHAAFERARKEPADE